MLFSPVSLLKRSLSRQTKLNLHYGLMKARYAFDFGRAVECPICGRRCSSFALFNGRPNAMCPRCFSLERHRRLYLFLRDRTDVFQRDLKILHFAAEKCLAVKLRARQGPNYVTADNLTQFIPMIEVKPDRIMSVTEIKDADDIYDLVICSHVLEHVVEDRLAMAEIRRVLKPGGCALIMVPINPDADATLEDFSLNEDQRRQFYGSPHHVRFYAQADLVRRLQESGFTVTLETQVQPQDTKRFVLSPSDIIFKCVK